MGIPLRGRDDEGALKMKTLTAIPIAELIKKAGSKRKVAQIAGIQNLGSLSHESVLIGDKCIGQVFQRLMGVELIKNW